MRGAVPDWATQNCCLGHGICGNYSLWCGYACTASPQITSPSSEKTNALDTAANGVVITNAKGIILWVNSAFTALTGYSSEEVLGKTPSLLKSGKHDREFYQNLWTALLAGQTWHGDFTNRRKDGSLYQDEHTITPVRSKEGVITHFIAIMNEVTARKRAEQKLTLLSTCASSLTDIVMVIQAKSVDEPGPRIIFVNDVIERLTVKRRSGRRGKGLNSPFWNGLVSWIKPITSWLGPRREPMPLTSPSLPFWPR